MSQNNNTRAWQRMLSGRRLDLLDPSPLDVEIEDIAHGLAFVARWNGQTIGDEPYSVAAHSVLVEEIFSHRHPHLSDQWKLAALLHDGAEYVLGDMISPAKAVLGGGFGKLETRVQEAIHIRFSLPKSLPKEIKAEIKAADKASAYLEARDLAGFNPRELKQYFEKPKERAIAALRPEPCPPKEARAKFLARFGELTAKDL